VPARGDWTVKYPGQVWIALGPICQITLRPPLEEELQQKETEITESRQRLEKLERLINR